MTREGDIEAAARKTVELIRSLAGYEIGDMHPNDFAVRDLEIALDAPTDSGSLSGPGDPSERPSPEPREQEPQKPPVGVAWMREQLKRIFFRWAGADSGSPEMHNRDVEIDGLLLDHWTAPVFRVQASQQPQQDDVSAAREAFDNAVAVSILRVACQHIDGLDISKQSSCPEDMAMWAVTYIERLLAEAGARCQCADMQGGKLCRACLEDEEATDV